MAKKPQKAEAELWVPDGWLDKGGVVAWLAKHGDTTVSEAKLQRWARVGADPNKPGERPMGPQVDWGRVPGRILYRQADVERWHRSGRTEAINDPALAPPPHRGGKAAALSVREREPGEPSADFGRLETFTRSFGAGLSSAMNIMTLLEDGGEPRAYELLQTALKAASKAVRTAQMVAVFLPDERAQVDRLYDELEGLLGAVQAKVTSVPK